MDIPKISLLVAIALVLILASIHTYRMLRRPTVVAPAPKVDPNNEEVCTIDDISQDELSAVARLLLSLNGKGRFGSMQGSIKLSRSDFGTLSGMLAVLLGFDDIDAVPDEEAQVTQFCDTLAADIGFKQALLRYPEILEDAFNGYRLQDKPEFLDVSMPFMPSVTTVQTIYMVAIRRFTAADHLAKADIPSRDLTFMAEWILGCGGYGYATFEDGTTLPITDEDDYADLIFGLANLLGYGYTAALPDDTTSYKLIVQRLAYECNKEFIELLVEFGAFLTRLKMACDEQLAHNSSHNIASFIPDDLTFQQLRELHANFRLVKH